VGNVWVYLYAHSFQDSTLPTLKSHRCLSDVPLMKPQRNGTRECGVHQIKPRVKKTHLRTSVANRNMHDAAQHSLHRHECARPSRLAWMRGTASRPATVSTNGSIRAVEAGSTLSTTAWVHLRACAIDGSAPRVSNEGRSRHRRIRSAGRRDPRATSGLRCTRRVVAPTRTCFPPVGQCCQAG
jgi:hypothetical protein